MLLLSPALLLAEGDQPPPPRDPGDRLPGSDRPWGLISQTSLLASLEELTSIGSHAGWRLSTTSGEVAARAWLDKIEADRSQPPTPWFQAPGAAPLHFVDFGGWEATHDSDMIREETLSKTGADVLAEEGIYLTQVSAARDRGTLTRRMLEIRPEDGLPRTIIDPSNELLISAFAGGLSFKKPTPEDPLPTKYQKDGTHDNVYEAYTYGEVGVVPLNRPKPEAVRISHPTGCESRSQSL